MIVSDVGGTNGRFAVAEFSENHPLPAIKNIQVLPCRSFSSFADMFEAYVQRFDGDLPKIAHFSIAGEMNARRGNLWHFNWDIDAAELENKFGFDHVTLLNDYEALLYVIPHLTSNGMTTLTPFSTGLSNAPFSVFGVGSGLGAAIGNPTPAGLTTIPTEIGHISFSPKSEIEIEMLSHFKKTIDHVSIETFLSGPGLKRIHDFLVLKEGGAAGAMTASDITATAKHKNMESCVKAVNIFTSILGSVAGDIALAQGAKGGIYIGGGIVPKIKTLINHKSFLERFNDKGPMQDYVNKIPVHIITADMPSLLGAALIP